MKALINVHMRSTGGFSRAQAGINAWTPDGPYGGSVFALAIDPRTPSTLYAGIPRAGVFKSTDGGGSWWTANTGLTDTNVRALAIDPVTPTALYAGTGHGVFALQQTTSGSR